ncbi:hypothetical protein EV652_11718 [Kribbella steppae]|uniref:Uncharacterized protein n=1 Tax=Kribbella steppae TaxID=2512223 RepID=A0A4R2H0D3_9ACTN|nr:hypothetical protein EV652_11718 [Kribbella steppae]
MRPVPQHAAARFGAAVPSVPARHFPPEQLPSFTGLGPDPTSPACCAALGGTCSRLQGMWGQAHGAMTAALVIVPADPVCARFASAHGGRVPGSSVMAVSSRTRPRPREVLSGAPWMVRLSMGSGDLMSPARLAPARKHPWGPTGNTSR